MNMRILLVGALMLGVSACTTTDINGNKVSLLDPDRNSGVAVAMNKALEFTPSGDTQTASSGDVLFKQSASVVHGAKIKTEFKTSSLPLLGVNFKVTPDHILYPAITQKFGMIYCTLGKSGKELFMLDYRTCFRDSDADDAFDQVWMTDENGGVYEGYATVWASYLSSNKISEPLEFQKIDESDMPLDTFGVQYKYNKTLFGKESLTFTTVTLSDAGKPDSLATVSNSKTINLKTASFPMTISLSSASIEVLSYEDKQITYRVDSGYKAGLPVLLGRQRKPVVVYY